MQDQDVITKEFYGDAARVADFVNGYLFEGVQLVRPENISELDSSMFGKIKYFLQNRSSASKMKNFIRDNEAELCQVDDDAYDMMAVMSHSEELEQMKNRFRKGGKVDMCKALREWLDESKQEGVTLGLEEQGLEQGIKASPPSALRV